jgi:hypothetical protein
VGYGVPNLSRAIECLNSRVTLIAECELQPFRNDNGEILFNEMHVHTMPWADTVLKNHPYEQVRLRVTLSYFIEPNPGNRGYTSHYRYAGCQLRYCISNPGQSVEDLEALVSKHAADEMKARGRLVIGRSSDGWILGDESFRGSVHSDVWEGSCADAISMKHLAVYPVTGWWRTRARQNKSEARIKYALVVTLESQNPALDLYSEIAAQIAAPVSTPVTVNV